MRLLRDSWGWRGGLAADELRYDPRPADAMAGPIRAPAAEHWPNLVSSIDIAARALELDRAPEEAMSALTAHILLQERTGGYHAVVPADLPDVAARHREVCGLEGLPDLAHGLAFLEAVGAIERTPSRIATVRPALVSDAALVRLRSALDVVDSGAAFPQASLAFNTLAWQTIREGIAAQRFRELSRAGRLAAHVAPGPGPNDTEALWRVGPVSLPSLVHVLSTEQDAPHGSRGWISGAAVRFDPPARNGHGADAADGPWPLDRDGRPLRMLVGAHEMAARLLGLGVGSNAMRRAVRGSGMWLVVLRHLDGRPGTFDTTVASLSAEFGPLYGLDAQGDNRAYASLLLGDLERVGAVTLDRPTRKTLRVEVRRPDAPADAELAHFLNQWAVWRAAGDGDPQGALSDSLALAGVHLRDRVRGTWVELLESRRLRVEVLPPVAG